MYVCVLVSSGRAPGSSDPSVEWRCIESQQRCATTFAKVFGERETRWRTGLELGCVITPGEELAGVGGVYDRRVSLGVPIRVRVLPASILRGRNSFE